MKLLNNRYQILETIGSGGCGETYLAEDTHLPSRRPCVVKVLKPVTENQKARELIKERFQREAVVLERLGRGCQQIPELYAHFVEENEFYLVQERISGKNLAQLVASDGALSEDRVKDFLAQLLPVLKYIHSQGIIHRDIKPENIILDESGKYHLIDFGVVKELMTGLTEDQAESIVVTSYGYSAPEQAVGKPVFSSDLYSLALTAVFLLTGGHPGHLLDPQEGKISWESLGSPADDRLLKVLEKASEPNYLHRFKSADEMLDALVQSTDTYWEMPDEDNVPAPGPPTPGPPEQKPPKSRIGLVTTIMLISLATVLGLAFYSKWKEYNKVEPRAEIKRVWMEDNKLDVNGKEGIAVHVTYSIHDIPKTEYEVDAYFYRMDGTPVKPLDPKYGGTPLGYVATAKRAVATDARDENGQADLFMPYENFELLLGKADFKFQIVIKNAPYDKKDLADSSFYKFTATNPHPIF